MEYKFTDVPAYVALDVFNTLATTHLTNDAVIPFLTPLITTPTFTFSSGGLILPENKRFVRVNAIRPLLYHNYHAATTLSPDGLSRLALDLPLQLDGSQTPKTENETLDMFPLALRFRHTPYSLEGERLNSTVFTVSDTLLTGERCYQAVQNILETLTPFTVNPKSE